MTATTAFVPLTCPPPWVVGAAGRAAAARAASPRPAVSLRVPLVAGDEWFWEVVGTDEVEHPVEVVRTDDKRVWGLVAAPLGLVLQVALADLLQVVVPGPVLALELVMAGLLLARADAMRLTARGLAAPSPWSALLPPLYLFRRTGITHDVRMPLAWFGVAAFAAVMSVVVDGRLAPVHLPSHAVENVLYEQLFERQLPLDALTGTIQCPAFSQRWVGQDFRCVGTDDKGTIPLEVTVVDRSGALTWQPLRATP